MSKYTLQYMDFREMIRAEQIIAASDSEAVEIAKLRVGIYRSEFRKARGVCRRRWYVLLALRNEDTAELVFPIPDN